MPVLRPGRITRALSVVAVLFVLALPAHGATVLRMNHQFMATAAGSVIDQWFADEVARLSHGNLRIKIHWAGALGGPKENLTLLGAGAIDMAAMSAGYFPSELPFFAAPNSMPMAMDDIHQASRIMLALMDEIPAYAEEAATHGIRPVFFHVLNPYYLVSREPLRDLASLKGKKIRTWGEDIPQLVQAAEAVPVTIFLPELYENLQRGVIDATPFSVDLMMTYGIHEVAKHVTEVVIWEGPSWGVWISLQAWNRLNGTQRDILGRAAEAARLRELDTAEEAARTARADLIKRGVNFHAFPAAELAAWQAASPDFFQLWIDRMDHRGKGDDARQAVDLWRRTRRESR